MKSKIPTLLCLALFALAAFPAAASASAYHVYGCRMPSGAAAPADGWTSSRSGGHSHAEDACAEGGALKAALDAGAARAANTEYAEWTFTAPAQATVAAATLWRSGDAAGGAAFGALFGFWLGGPTEALTPEEVFDSCVAGTCASGLGESSVPQGGGNRVVVPARSLGGGLHGIVACRGESGFPCPTSTSDSHGYAAALYLYASDITLEQAAGPSASNVGGELATAASVAGSPALSFAASDPGAGVWRALVYVDGNLVQTTALAESDTHCRQVGEAADGLPAFLYVQPCPQSLNADLTLDTTAFTNGTHRLLVQVQDAAGNTAPVLDHSITVANPTGSTPSGPGPAQAGASVPPGTPNGSAASGAALLTLAWQGQRSSRMSVPYGRAAVVSGRLTSTSGAAIAGAAVEVAATPTAAGASSIAMAAVRTGADGSFTLRVPAGVSRTLTFSYRAHAGDASPAAAGTLSLAVGAAVTLSISPRVTSVGRHIRFTGRLLGGPFPYAGKLLVLQARSPGGRWITFDVVRADRHGRYSASYRFRFPGPARYQFRVLSEAEGDYPYAAGSSPVVGVRELP